jgi:hypothetical protein
MQVGESSNSSHGDDDAYIYVVSSVLLHIHYTTTAVLTIFNVNTYSELLHCSKCKKSK